MKILDTLKKCFISENKKPELSQTEYINHEPVKEEIKMNTNSQKIRYFQWIKGEHLGKISASQSEPVEEDGLYYLEFTDGLRINTELINEFVVEIPSATEPMILKEEMVPKTVTTPKVTVTTSTPKEVSEKNPIQELLSKAKHTETSVTISVSLELPSESLVSVILDSFGAEGKTQIFSYLTKSLKSQDIHELLVEEIWKQIYGKD